MSTDTEETDVESPVAAVHDEPMYRFRVQNGTYWKPEPLKDDRGRTILDKDGRIQTRDVIYGPRRPAGDIVHTNVRLDKKFNSPVSTLFVLLDDNNSPIVDQLQKSEERAIAAEKRYRRALAAMNQRELLDHAKAESVDLRGEIAVDKVQAILLRAAGLDPRPSE